MHGGFQQDTQGGFGRLEFISLAFQLFYATHRLLEWLIMGFGIENASL